MVGPVKTVCVFVEDQQRALEFYTQKLGFELRRNESMGPTANWLEVAPPGAQTSLVLYPKAMMTNWQEMKPAVRFHCTYVEDTCPPLEANGVCTPAALGEFGTRASGEFADPDGNEFGMTSQKLA
jgi:predicted enzyme related to lactoylglutathione lyase